MTTVRPPILSGEVIECWVEDGGLNLKIPMKISANKKATHHDPVITRLDRVIHFHGIVVGQKLDYENTSM